MERKTLPAREKQIREDEWHLFCPGEGCSARLGIRKGLIIWLETRYTLKPHPGPPFFVWWREREGGYQYIPRQRGIRRLVKRGLPQPWPDVFPQYLSSGSMVQVAIDRYLSGMAARQKPLPRRDAYRPMLLKGRHVVICYKCGGAALVEQQADIDNGP